MFTVNTSTRTRANFHPCNLCNLAYNCLLKQIIINRSTTSKGSDMQDYDTHETSLLLYHYRWSRHCCHFLLICN